MLDAVAQKDIAASTGSGRAGSGPEPEEPESPAAGDTRLDAFIKNHARARAERQDRILPRVGAALPDGSLDEVTARWLSRACDFAVLTGHPTVTCVHLATAIASDPVHRRDYVLPVLQRWLPGFDASVALKTCLEHAATDLNLVAATEVAEINLDPNLVQLFEAARAKSAVRAPEARFIEADHLLEAAAGSVNPRTVEAWGLLKGERPLSLETLAEKTKSWIDSSQSAVSGSIGGYTQGMNAHAAQAQQAALEQNEQLRKILSAMHGDIHRVAQLVEDQSRSGLEAIRSVGQAVGEHRRETAQGLATSSGLVIASDKGVTDLIHDVHATARTLTPRFLTLWATFASVLLASAVSFAAGYLLR